MSDDDPNARGSDPDTSKRAGANIRAETRRDRARVYGIFRQYHPQPLADFELEALLGGPCNGKWRKRRSDLKDDGVLIAVSRTINPASRKEVIRWGLNMAHYAAVTLNQSTNAIP